MASSTTAATSTPKFSAGSDEQALTRTLEPLLESAGSGGRWTLTPNGAGLERSFKFKTFGKTWVYNTTYIRWTTHNPQGMSAKDVELAAVCDGLARDFGEIVDEEGGGGATCEMRRLADRGALSAGDCCGVK
ncbi:hypothetical protein DL764_005414 [Monosporascus ibericus]|uniref:Uncharacterized protein n=1 Tax=Monosporascus ibericus TaxID=155417 RepID=A0A4Q4T946_9PEZI|nr:hypothetical protein DL764_005414 [Monosporascus ibericus]